MKSALLSLALFGAALPLHAASVVWDADPSTPGAQDGGGAWDNVGTNWWSGGANTNWNDATPDSAVIGVDQGAAGTISLGAPRTAQGLSFNRSLTGSYVVTNGALLVGAGGINLAPYVATNKLLDTVSVQPAGAWSLRRLRTSYAGPVVTVRRPSDGATTDIYFDVTGFLDTNALALFVGTETGTVARWYDQSGNARDGVQATAANQPQLDKPNGKWAILGRGNQWLVATNCTVGQMITGGSNGTAALVYRAQPVSQATFGWYQSTSSDMRWSAHMNWGDVGNVLYFDPGSVAGARVNISNAINNNVWQQYTLIRSNANSTIRWGGMERTTATGRSGACTPSATQWGVLGAVNTPGPAYGDMVEYLQFSNGLSTSDLQLVEQSQGVAFGIGALDVVDVPAAGAWSLRKLRTAYTGAVVNVRRPSDGVTTDILFDITGFLDTNALAVFLGGQTGTVARWYDQSGNGRDGVQNATANQPQLDQPNGKWAIIARGNQWLTVTNCTVLQMTMGGSNGTAALVYRAQQVAQATFGWYDGGTRWSAHVTWSDGTLYFDPGNAAGARVQVGNTGNNGVWQQYSLIRSNGYAAVRWAGVDRVTSTTRAGAITSTGTQWGVLSAVGATPYAYGDMAEYIQFANGLGPTNLLALEANQAGAFGTLTAGTLGPTYYATVASPVTLQAAQAWTASNGAVLAVSGDVDKNGQDLSVNGVGFVNLSGAISGAGALSKIGTGALVLSGTVANTYSGLTTLTNGTMGLAKPAGVAAVPGDLTADNVLSPDLFTKANNQFNPAAVLRFTGTSGDHARLELLGTTQTLAGVENAAGTGRGVIQQREQVTEPNVGGASRLVLGGAGAYTFNGYFRDTGGLMAFTKNGSGTQTLAGANINFTGPTAMEAGRLILSNASAFASAISNATEVEFADSAVGVMSKALTGAGTWFKTGVGTQQLNGGTASPIAPSGQFYIQQGVLQNNNNAVNWSNNLAGIDISAGAALDLYADPVLTPTLTGAGTVRSTFGNSANYSGIASNTERLTVGLTNASSLFAGTLTDTGTNGTGIGKGFLELLKVGSGTLTLSGTNTHGGATLISGGTLALAASGSLRHSALISVSNGAIFDVTAAGSIQLGTNQALGGAGTVLGSVVAQAGSRLTPGLDAIGTLSIAGSVGLHASSTNVFNLGGVTNEGGAFNDLVAITGDLEPSNSVVRIDPVAPLANGTYRMFTYTGAKTTAFNPAPVASLGRKGAYLDEAIAGQVNLVVTGAYGALVWLPQANALWNTTDGNWSNTVAAALDFYTTLDEVQFNAAGAYSNTVSIPAAVTPSLVTVSGASNYTFVGSAIAGVGSLVKTGTGTLTILNTNSFLGPTTINDGVLQLGDGGVINNLGGTAYINVTNTGVLSMYAAANVTVAQAVRGNGTWLTRGPGVSGQGHFDPTNDNSQFSGTLISTNSRFVCNSPLDVGAASSIIAQDRGQFWLNAGTNNRPLFITGLGWVEGSQLGALRLSSATNAGPVTLTGYARIGTYSTGERGVVSGNISGPYTLELWNGGGGYTILTGTNTFSDLNLVGGWHYFGHSGALGSGTINFNNGGLAAYLAPLIVTNPVQLGVIAMHVGNDLGYLPITFANSITITNSHVDANIYNTSTVVGAFSGGGTKGIYKYAPGELRLAGTNALGWIECIQAGTVSYVSNSVTTLSGNMNFRAGSTMNLSDNAQVEANQSFLGTSANGNWGTLNVYGGRLRLNSLDTTRVLTIGEFSGATSYVNIYGGELHVTNGTARTYIGWSGGGQLRIHGGLALLKTIRAAGQGGGIDLDGGELRVGAGGIDWTGGPQPVINLGGGTLSAMDDWSSSIPMSVNGTNGNTQVNGAGYTIALGGAMSGTGGLSKVGSGTLLLNGTWNAGAIAVNGGTLGGTGTLNASVAVAAGALVQPGTLLIDGRLSASSVTFAANAVFNPLAVGTACVLRVAATNGLSVPVGGTVATVNVLNAVLPVGTYTVIDYEGAIQGGDVTNLVLGILPPRSVMYLTNNVGNTSVDLVVVTASESIKWLGNVDGNWNIDAPTNWVTAVGGLPTAYLQPGPVGDALVFDDTALGNFSITLRAPVSPALVTASNAANDYTIGGTNGISSLVALRKYGAARFTLAMSNNFPAGVAIYGGTLQLGDGAKAGSIGAGLVTNDGVLAISHSETNTFANVIRGTGSLVKSGPGRVTLTSASTYTGGTIVNAGELALGVANNLAGALTINTDGVVRATAQEAVWAFTGITVNTGGVLRASAPGLYNGITGGLTLQGGTVDATVAGNTTYGNFYQYSDVTVAGNSMSVISADIRVHGGFTRTFNVGSTGNNIDLLMSGHLGHANGVTCGYFTKAGPGTMALSYPLNDICGTTVAAGRLLLLDASLNAAAPVNNAVLEFYTSPGSNQTYALSISGSGALVKSGAGRLLLTAPVVGAAGQVICAGGTLELSSTNTYGGSTIVSNGTMLVNGSIGPGVVTIDAGATLGGTGLVKGVVSQNGILSPGVGIGLLTISNQVSCGGASVTRFELGGTNSYDQLVVSDLHILNGTLEVVTTNGYVPVSGDRFNLITNTALGGLLFGPFPSTSLPALPSGMGWEVQYSASDAVNLVVTGSVVSLTAYEQWAAQIPNPSDRSDQMDPDNDGYANLLEYSQGSDPTNNANNAKLNLVRTNGMEVIVFNRVNTATDIVYEVQASYAPTNNAEWLGLATNSVGSWGSSTNVNDDNTATIHRVWVSDLILGTNRSLRLKVTRP